MIRKKAQYEQALQLRKRGFTYAEIAKITDVSKSTIFQWFSGEVWSQLIKDKNTQRAFKENSKRISLLNKARGNQHKKMYAEAERSAETEYKHFKKDALFVAGLMIYACNGDNTHTNPIRLTSHKIANHRIFIRFANEYMGVSRENVRFWLILYPEMLPEKCSRHWSKIIGIPLSQFHKYQVIQGKITKKTLHFGVGNTIIGSTIFKHKLMKWTKLILKELQK